MRNYVRWSDEANGENELQKARHEICQLQDELKSTNNALCKAEEEKASLVTALKLLQIDRELQKSLIFRQSISIPQETGRVLRVQIQIPTLKQMAGRKFRRRR